MNEFETTDEPGFEDEDIADNEIDFKDNGKPANYIFCVTDTDIGPALCVVPAEYWDAEHCASDWQLELEVPGCYQEMEGCYILENDAPNARTALEILHRRAEKLGLVFSPDLANYLEEANSTVIVYRHEAGTPSEVLKVEPEKEISKKPVKTGKRK